ncbi:MAG TPA: cupin domain-containing protein [Candidatus Dormibacteraeota bacterium]|nr:cupin domain-containing protein [Candidatus Dormibacteraeota bacterium]
MDAERSTSGIVVLKPDEGRRIDLGNFAMSLKVAGEETGGAFALLEATEPPDFGPPMHIHHTCGEAFFVVEGEYRIFIEAEEHRCPAGSFIYIPSGVPHGFRVGPKPSRKINLYTPAAMVGYFDELSAAIRAGTADPDTLDQIAERAGMEVIGPVPEGYL